MNENGTISQKASLNKAANKNSFQICRYIFITKNYNYNQPAANMHFPRRLLQQHCLSRAGWIMARRKLHITKDFSGGGVRSQCRQKQ